MTRHKHADVIIAWAEGKEIEIFHNTSGKWVPMLTNQPCWDLDSLYRIKPEPKQDFRVRLWNNNAFKPFYLTFVFDGETKEFKTVEYHDNDK
jgi:hypothetical protein